MAIILDGQSLSEKIRKNLKPQVKIFESLTGKPPVLNILMAGNDPASQIYVNNKIKACQSIGIECILNNIESSDNFINLEKYMIFCIEKANNSPDIDAIIVQLNLPRNLNQNKIINTINPNKDIDVLTAENLGLLVQDTPRFESCTPLGIMNIFEEYNINLVGKKTTIINSSNIVGKPLFHMMTKKGSTVTMCHIQTPKHTLIELTKKSDIIVSATGTENFITKDMVNEKSTIIDVSIIRKENKIVGDCDFNSLKNYVQAITPVPKGVGPMTIAMLLQNTIKAAFRNKNIDYNMILDSI